MSELLVISETKESKQYWLEQGLGKGFEEEINAAAALIVPEKNFREEVAFVFHHDTTRLYRYLLENLGGDLSLEICSNDDEYCEISLHSSSFRLSTLVISYLAAPLLVGLLTNYLYDELKAKPNDSVEATLIVEDHECRSFKFAFKGEAKDFVLLTNKVGELASTCAAATGKRPMPAKVKK